MSCLMLHASMQAGPANPVPGPLAVSDIDAYTLLTDRMIPNQIA